ncbi:MAG TPA: hypothetical protein VEC57_19800 [Candidatus Limnocylindrales bacterium]|nr:hypothetical protein [Candidatus Limnocylindrales bacterium]
MGTDVGSASAEQTKILAEVAHDLANRFHRFYYYAEILGRLLPEDTGEARDYLDRVHDTVEDIERMTRGALSYLRPMEVRTVRVQVRDVVGSLRQHVGDRAVEVGGLESAGGMPVAVDPSRLGEALGHACRAVLAHAPDAAPLRIDLRAASDIDITFSAESSQTEALPFDLSLALAAKILRLHGGDLEVAPAQPATLSVRLPLADQE